ncbi:serine/threonine-protein kinase PLK1-like isoform X1 [Tachypleus tridentatus]|uniref:serine/threonine-protein kinase PLK1-like isoform X1 n=2 Tax=Tachypleus tridentatus TaxID=6853 RepID=UPI003FD0E9FB
MATKYKENTRVKVVKEISDVVIDCVNKKRYIKGRFLGKGGFAKCYELMDMETKEVFAGKIVPKAMLSKQHQKEKITQEIAIHRSLNHKNIVGFQGYFEDTNYVYIVLELCRRRSLMEMHKRRKVITEPETRYFMQQIVTACKYLHEQKVIHRDLKLGNLFLSNEMEIKLGDFGLATRIDYVGERKRTLCGTPNYIAPEVLGKKGHSFEVDSWSLGCILYTMVVGRPPFETSSLKDTYSRIKRNEYHIPSRVSLPVRQLIQKLLNSDPSQRPNMDQVLNDEFMTLGYLPPRLPTSCLTMAPRFEAKNVSIISSTNSRTPLLEINSEEQCETLNKLSTPEKLTTVVKDETIQENCEMPEKIVKPFITDVPADYYLSDMFAMLASVVKARPADKAVIQEDEALDPAAIPIFWVSKWVDYTDKYGLGYQLSDNSVGVLFNDSTRIILLADELNVQYIERDGQEGYYNLQKYPETLNKKITLLKYFCNYMNEHLLKAGESIVPREGDELIRLPYLRSWFRTRSAIVLHLTNGTLQINFFQDHTKIILCPLMGAVTYINGKEFRTFRLKLIEDFGCSQELASRLLYARTMTERLLTSQSGSSQKKMPI